jgi:hypothetical protein
MPGLALGGVLDQHCDGTLGGLRAVQAARGHYAARC